MKTISLKNIEGTLSRDEMRNINGGRSWATCTRKSICIKIFGWTIKESSGNTDEEWDKCREGKKGKNDKLKSGCFNKYPDFLKGKNEKKLT